MVDTAVFLGAGASKAEGAPLQGELFREYFSSELFDPTTSINRELARFFEKIFSIDVRAPQTSFPTFEEVLGLTDLATLRKESVRDFDLDGHTEDRANLRSISQYLVFLVAQILHSKLKHRAKFHRRLVEGLRAADELLNVVFISTNYDILIDNALNGQYGNGFDIDYGVDFRNFERSNTWQPPRPGQGVPLFKPHGSLNWLFCPTCSQLEITSSRLLKNQASRC